MAGMSNAFPKLVRVQGLEIVANSWEELDELIARYGAGSPASIPNRNADELPHPEMTLDESDHTLLERFVREAERGISVDEIRKELGRSGKGKVGSALRAWAAKIGLKTQSGRSPFEPRQLAQGRAHRLTDEALRAARVLLNRSRAAPSRNE